MPDRLRYSRQIVLPEIGEAGQRELAGASVLVVGLGGLGTPAAAYLAAAGIGHLTLNDFDSVDETNLARQFFFRSSDVGENKADVLARRLGEQNPGVHILPLDKRLNDQELAAEARAADVILDCTDNFQARQAINRAAVGARTVLISGAAIKLEGQLMEFGPDFSTSACYECVYPSADEPFENCRGSGILGPVTGTIGSMMAGRALLRLSGGNAVSHMSLYDAAGQVWQSLKITKRPDCKVCG